MSVGDMKKHQTIIPIGAVLKIKQGGNTRFWKVTGIHLGATKCENLVTLKTVDMDNGSAFGKTVKESIVPLYILATHPLIEQI